jgi:membrane-associated phospholipid phosphatase
VRIDNVPIGGHTTSAAAVRSSDHSWISQQLLRNDSAAVPSLHAAYALLVTLFSLTLSRRWGLLAIPYTLGMWFAIVYFGEHYVSDAIIGALLALAVFLALRRLWPRTPLAGPFPPPLAPAPHSPVRHQVV